MKTEQELLDLAKEKGWNWISIYQKLSEEFIEKYADEVNWVWVSRYQKLSEKFIEKYSDKIDWNWISIYQKLSEEFIEKYSDKVEWDWISIYQKLSEEFIEKHSYNSNWYWISKYQKLSEEFIEKHSNKVNWYHISKYQKLSEEFRKKHNIEILEDNWLYTTKEEKLKFIQEHTNYEVIDEQYIIAYKTVRNDYYSVFSFQYKYEIGKTYESHCDCNLNIENSFGLSAWIKEQALEYYNRGRLLKVKINIEDIGAIVRDCNKIRCFKLEILEEI